MLSTPNYKDPVNLIAAFIMIMIACIGISSNLLIVYIFIRTPTERTSFNVICVFRAIGNFIILAWLFCGTFIPITLVYVNSTIECFMYYTSIDLTWYPNMEKKCDDDSDQYINMTAAFVIVMGILNIATFSKIYFFYHSTGIDVKERNKKIRKNRALFLQTMIQDAITLIDMIFTFKLSLMSESRVWLFFCGTVIWEIVHSLDGLIMVMFNERLTFLKKTFFVSSASPSLVLTAKVTPSAINSTYPPPIG
uniref:7TM_GPCR_Srx domain-containing protein n=1 Tax=Caenorhabditis tropicalis TaxID=1561998 RepID=A0A1I7UAT4_9PELO